MSEHEPTCMFKANAANDPDECGGCEYARVQRWEKAQHRTDCTWERGYLVCDCAELNAAVEAAENEMALYAFNRALDRARAEIVSWCQDNPRICGECGDALAAIDALKGRTDD